MSTARYCGGAARITSATFSSRFRTLVLIVGAIVLLPASASAGRISLAWDPSPSVVSGYTIYYGTSSGSETWSVNTTQTTYTLSGLTNGVRYYFVVKAFSASGLYSTASNEVNGLPSNATPTLQAVSGRSNDTDDAVTLQLVASDADGDSLTFSASGLPPGLKINASTGSISGVPTTAGTYAVTVTVSDGQFSASRPFTWTIVPLVPPSGMFTDDPLLPGVHAMRVLHITELRSRIGALRTLRGLAPMAWTTLIAGTTVIRASHIAELRGALNAIYSAARLRLPAYTDDPLAAGTPIKAVHITELRSAVKALE